MKKNNRTLLYLAIATSNILVSPAVFSSEKTIEEIVVTAQRRAENAFEVPISVSVVSAQNLEAQGIRDMIGLSQAVPGLVMSTTGGNVQPSIRGIQTQIAGPGLGANVAVYLDGVYLPVSNSTSFNLPDVEQIEVLKGPQGTLYGRNVTGGAIRVFTKAPNMNELEGSLTTGYSEFDTWYARGFVSGPIIENTLAYSLSASREESDGYVDDLVNGGEANPSERWHVRAKLLWTPSEDLDINLSAFYTDINDPTVFATSNLDGNTLGKQFGAMPIASRPNTAAVDAKLKLTNMFYGGSLKIDYDLGFATLSSTTAAGYLSASYNVDGDSSTAPLAVYRSYGNRRDGDKSDNIQQEITLTSNGDSNIDWVVGGYYFDNESLALLEVPLGGPAVFNQYEEILTEAKALFGEVKWSITDRLSTTVGFRHSRESTELSGNIGINIPTSTSLFVPLGDESWNSNTPRFVVSYLLNDNTNIYASYSEGFKSGHIDSNDFSVLEPEELEAWEVGLKSSDIMGWRLDLAAYYYDYTNQQVATYTEVAGVPLSSSENAASTEIYGLDLTAFTYLSDNLSLSIGLSIMDAEIADFPNASVSIPLVDSNGTLIGGNMPDTRDVSGNEGVRAPDWTLATTLTHQRDYSFGELSLSATVYHSDDVFHDYGNRIKQDAYTTLDLRPDLSPANTPWRFSLWGKNLTDEEIIQTTFITDLSDAIAYLPPRSIGVEAKYSF